MYDLECIKQKNSTMTNEKTGRTYFLLLFLKSSNTTGSPVFDVDVRGDDLVEVVSPTVGAPLFNQAETRVGVGACFFLTARPPAVASLHVEKMAKKDTKCETQKIMPRLANNEKEGRSIKKKRQTKH